MNSRFAMDPGATRAELSGAEVAGVSAVAQAGSPVAGVQPGGYMMSLLAMVGGGQLVRQAAVLGSTGANMVRREVSVAAVQTSEATNSAVLSC